MYVVKESRDMTSFYRFIYDFQFQKWFVVYQIVNILKQIACENKLINYRNLKKACDSQKPLKAVTRAPPSVPDVLNYAISYVRLIYVVLYQKLIFNKWDSKFNHISLKGCEGDDYKFFWKNWLLSSSKLINTPTIILVIKLEFRRAPGTDG